MYLLRKKQELMKITELLIFSSEVNDFNWFCHRLTLFINPLVPNAPFLYPLKTLGTNGLMFVNT